MEPTRTRAASAYRNVYIDSASPTKTLDEVYERILLHCREAAEGIGRKDFAKKGVAISKALAFVGALEASIDMKPAPELGLNLLRLYRFVVEKLSEANIKMVAKPLAEAEQVIVVLRDAFRQAAA
jgi:flagellar secretion chaperone FliS